MKKLIECLSYFGPYWRLPCDSFFKVETTNLRLEHNRDQSVTMSNVAVRRTCPGSKGMQAPVMTCNSL